MNQHTEQRDHDELDLLLPWYVNGTLAVDEKAEVERHLRFCVECRENVDLLNRMQDSVKSESPSPIVPRQRVDDLLTTIEEHDRGTSPATLVTPRAMVAAIAVVVLGVVLLISSLDLGIQEAQQFETATSGNPVLATSYVVAVRFAPETTAARREEVIASVGGASLGPGAQPDTYRVAISVAAETLEELSQFTREIEARAEVQKVQVIAVQLPVESSGL